LRWAQWDDKGQNEISPTTWWTMRQKSNGYLFWPAKNGTKAEAEAVRFALHVKNTK